MERSEWEAERRRTVILFERERKIESEREKESEIPRLYRHMNRLEDV